MLFGRKSLSWSLAVLFPLFSVSKQGPSHITQFQVLTPLFAFRVSLNYSSGRCSELSAYLPPAPRISRPAVPCSYKLRDVASSSLQLRFPLVPEMPRLGLCSSDSASPSCSGSLRGGARSRRFPRATGDPPAPAAQYPLCPHSQPHAILPTPTPSHAH